ncbi:MAG: response regulator [Vicinamibacteria bacterium]|nr:response regulator [Vicinamibacteria bacterium]
MPTPSTPLAGHKILVADDQPAVRAVLEEILNQSGAETWMAEDGEAVLRLIENARPDLIMLDLCMPGMDGWTVLEKLGGAPATRGIPVILETVAGDLDSYDRAKKFGVAAFISKPFRLNEVVEICRRVLEGARPFQGTIARTGVKSPVEVRMRSGTLLATGSMIQKEANGALAELPYPLALGDTVTLVFVEGASAIKAIAEVRWVSRTRDMYCHGFAITSYS